MEGREAVGNRPRKEPPLGILLPAIPVGAFRSAGPCMIISSSEYFLLTAVFLLSLTDPAEIQHACTAFALNGRVFVLGTEIFGSFSTIGLLRDTCYQLLSNVINKVCKLHIFSAGNNISEKMWQ